MKDGILLIAYVLKLLWEVAILCTLIKVWF